MLNVRELTDDEKASRTMDYLSGYEIIDSEMRLIVIEGLGGINNSVDQFYKEMNNTIRQANKLFSDNKKSETPNTTQTPTTISKKLLYSP